MKILLTNDDGIQAKGLERLARIALRLTDEVYVVAPDRQRSAISHSITIGQPLHVKRVDFPFKVKAAFSCSGTPSDCVKVAVNALLADTPDLILSGINYGYNMGYDTIYSGTIAAAAEACYWSVPSAAISTLYEDFTYVDRYLEKMLRVLFLADTPAEDSWSFMSQQLAPNEFWNLNFPGYSPSGCRGIKNTVLGERSYYLDTYKGQSLGKEEWEYHLQNEVCPVTNPDSDLAAVAAGYISVEKLRSFA